MQLSVFLTPIFVKNISVGFGVCEELAVFSQFKTPVTPLVSSHLSSNRPTQSDDMAGMSMADMSNMMDEHRSHEATSSVVQAKSLASNQPQAQVEPHHHKHAQCEFCLLLGHTVLPPLHVVIAVLLTPLIAKMMVKAKATDALFLNQNKNLRPQGRAPPQFAVLTLKSLEMIFS